MSRKEEGGRLRQMQGELGLELLAGSLSVGSSHRVLQLRLLSPCGTPNVCMESHKTLQVSGLLQQASLHTRHSPVECGRDCVPIERHFHHPRRVSICLLTGPMARGMCVAGIRGTALETDLPRGKRSYDMFACTNGASVLLLIFLPRELIDGV